MTTTHGAFAAEVADLARRHKALGRVQAATTNGYTVLLTGMHGGRVEALVITDPDGHQFRRADGWQLSKTAEVAEFLWHEMAKHKARAAERERQRALKSVSITAADLETGAKRATREYRLTSEQLAQVRSLAAQLASANAAPQTTRE